jgi:metallo-beta-lactamase class B
MKGFTTLYKFLNLWKNLERKFSIFLRSIFIISSKIVIMRKMLATIFVLLFSLTSSLNAQPTQTFREWNQLMKPFHIAGQLYYVGMANITSLLITTKEGHILIDGAFAESAAAILDNVRKLGFKPEDIKILLSTHAHIDHAGGLAEIKMKTNARLYAGAADSVLLATGGRNDFAFGDDLTFPQVKVDVPVKDGDEVKLGDITIHAIATPGHTKGCTAWTFTINEKGKPLHVVMIGGMSAPDYKLVNNSKYLNIAEDYKITFKKLKNIMCDIPIEGHGFFFGLEEKAAGKRSFVDPEGYYASVAKAEKAFHTELDKQVALSNK